MPEHNDLTVYVHSQDLPNQLIQITTYIRYSNKKIL